MPAESRRHHYVPKMLSKRFLDAEGRLWFFSEKDARHGIRPVSPLGAFWAPHLNTFEDSRGKKDASAESTFNAIETPADQLLDEITATLKAGQVPTLAADDRDLLDLFVYYQFKRPPEAFFDKVKGQDHETLIRRLLDEYEAKFGRPPTDEEVARILSPEGQRRIVKRGHVIATKDPGTDATAALRECGLFFGQAPPGKCFAIGGNPVLRNAGHLLNSNASMLMPISSEYAVGYGRKDMHGSIVSVPPAYVRLMNETAWRQSTAIGANNERLVHSLVKQSLKAAKRASPKAPY